MYEPFTRTEQEVARLAQNSKAMFDLLPDMLFIIQSDFKIERMNKMAVARLGDQNGRKCHEVIARLDTPCDKGVCPFHDKRGYGQILERKLGNDFFVEYSHIPFRGYRRDELSLVVVRDITRKMQHAPQPKKQTGNVENLLRGPFSREIGLIDQKHAFHKTGVSGSCDTMIGESRQIRATRVMIHQVAASDATILITGESGTGKELVADLVHRYSNRADKRYLKINCAAVAESLLESELFGYEKGAFTGANASRKGKFEEADHGTIFLDEIGEISPRMQSALLRVLQEGELIRVGSNRTISVDVRVIAATNIDLFARVKAGKFREDLYYRLNVVNLYQSPLRERKEDIILLARNFLMKYQERFKKEVLLSNSVIEHLLSYDWPGNIRELENAIQRAVLLSSDGVISASSLGISENKAATTKNCACSPTVDQLFDRSLKESVSCFEAEVISLALRESGGNIDTVSVKLGLGKTTLYEKMKRYGIIPKKSRNGQKEFNRDDNHNFRASL